MVQILTFAAVRTMPGVVHCTLLPAVIYREWKRISRYAQDIKKENRQPFTVLSNREMVKEYFRLVTEKDVQLH
jgi:hypothetical protein